jgi:hypothetical protein
MPRQYYYKFGPPPKSSKAFQTQVLCAKCNKKVQHVRYDGRAKNGKGWIFTAWCHNKSVTFLFPSTISANVTGSKSHAALTVHVFVSDGKPKWFPSLALLKVPRDNPAEPVDAIEKAMLNAASASVKVFHEK